jgi:anti-anti-sigma factor
VPLFDVIVDPVAGRLDLVGEFDLACGQRFREGSAALLAGDAHDVVVDLTRLRFIDASAIGILIELANALAAREAALRIINADARIGRVFSACRLDAMLSGRDRP